MFSSRWGFHPCDHATYRQLKFLNHVHQRALRLAAAWRRWHRKDPHNRVARRRIRNEKGQTVGYEPPVPIPEPRICAVFTRKAAERRHVDKHGRVSAEGWAEETVVTADLGIPADYSSARKPVAEPALVTPLTIGAAELDDLFESARRWLEQQDLG